MLTNESRAAGVAVNKSGTNAPYGAQEDAYKAAMWGGFAFGVLGALLAALFLRHVGVVGHRKDDVPPEGLPEDEETTAYAPGEAEFQRDGEKEGEEARRSGEDAQAR